MTHLISNNLINSSQHGFMNKKSCTTNLLEFMETITNEIDNNNNIDVVYLDFAKAFDKVPKERLIEKIRAQGVREKPLKWINNWLTDRRQKTVLNGESSDWGVVESGVPQGSVLGPLCFNIYINDLDESANDITLVKKFADDTKAAQTIETDTDKDKLQKGLDGMVDWASKWGMEFNVSKCKIMHIGRTNPRNEYLMNGQRVGTTDEERDIGVIISSNLKTSAQCREAARRANVVLLQIHYRDKRIFIQIYKQYVRPHLEFSVPAWSPWLQGDKDILERVQQRAIGMVSGLKGTSYGEKLRELGILSLERRRILYDLVQTYKIIWKKDDVSMDTWFSLVGEDPIQRTRFTSYKLNIVPKNSKCEIRRNFYTNRVVQTWNSLPIETKESKSVQAFKAKVKQMLLDWEE